MQTDPPLRPLQLNGTAYGWLLAVTTVLTLALIAHHPVADMHDRARGLQNIVAVGDRGRWVHGALIMMMVFFTTGFSGFAWRLGIAHPLVMAGWLSQLLGAVAMIAAAITDGFVIPDLAARMAGQTEMGYAMITLCGSWIQAETKLGFVLMALSAVFWGHALLHHKGGARWIGLLGIAAGGFSAAFILTMTLRFDVSRLFGYMTAQSAWYLTVAFWMMRGLKRPD
jgi:hypothetical protein